MKFSLLLAVLPALAMAAPTPENDKHVEKAEGTKWRDEYQDSHRGDKWDEHKDDDHKDDDSWKGSFPFEFTSTLVAYADGNQIINNSQVAVPGLAPHGWGKFSYGLNSEQDVICHNITVWIRGDYQSPAVTATHIHQAAKGAAGPPRIAFPNPLPLAGQPEDLEEYSWRQSIGCQRGPFVTGVVTNGTDTGSGFTIAQLEANPEGFFADTHTEEFPAGAIRGQIQWY